MYICIVCKYLATILIYYIMEVQQLCMARMCLSLLKLQDEFPRVVHCKLARVNCSFYIRMYIETLTFSNIVCTCIRLKHTNVWPTHFGRCLYLLSATNMCIANSASIRCYRSQLYISTQQTKCTCSYKQSNIQQMPSLCLDLTCIIFFSSNPLCY